MGSGGKMMITDVPARQGLPSQPTRSFPLVMVPDLNAVRAFYVDTLGCPITHHVPGRYLQVQLTAHRDAGPEVCFMVDADATAHDRLPVVLSVPVPDADAVSARLQEADVAIDVPVGDRPWGWRSVYVVDPAGLVLDFFHEIGETPNGAPS